MLSLARHFISNKAPKAESKCTAGLGVAVRSSMLALLCVSVIYFLPWFMAPLLFYFCDAGYERRSPNWAVQLGGLNVLLVNPTRDEARPIVVLLVGPADALKGIGTSPSKPR